MWKEEESEEDEVLTKVLSNKWLKYWSWENWPYDKYVLKKKIEWDLVYIFKTSTWSRKKKCELKMTHLEDIMCLKLDVHMVIMNIWRYA
jgi:hypothetical protein